MRTSLALTLEARLQQLYATGSTPSLITVSMEDWLDIIKRARDRATGNAIAGYTFAGVQVLINKGQISVVVAAKTLSVAALDQTNDAAAAGWAGQE